MIVFFSIVFFIVLIFVWLKYSGTVKYTAETLKLVFDKQMKLTRYSLIEEGLNEDEINQACLMRTLVDRKWSNQSNIQRVPWAEVESDGRTKFEHTFEILENRGLVNYSDIDLLMYASALIVHSWENNKILSDIHLEEVIYRLKKYKKDGIK
jgi:hypothetical protein